MGNGPMHSANFGPILGRQDLGALLQVLSFHNNSSTSGI